MASKKKLLQAAAGSAGSSGLDVNNVFSTFLYDGTGSNQTITNNIDLSGEGGLVWIKKRNAAKNHGLMDTEQGLNASSNSHYLKSNTTDAQAAGGLITAYNSNGFTTGAADMTNGSGEDYVSWTFRKAPKFFDVVTYTGNGVAGRTVSHNLGSVPGMMIVKKTNASTAWTIYHRSLGATKYLLFDTSDAGTQTARWNDTEPTSTQFTVGTSGGTNDNGDTYVAYLFAHNNSDGEFGPDGDADIIKCGSYTGNAGNPQVIDVGFEPQLLMVKCTSDTGDWFVVDNMRGVLPDGGYPCNNLYWNKTDAETLSGTFGFFANGFTAGQSSSTNGSGRTFIYMAIRRGPLAAPDDATKVFAMDTSHSDGNNTVTGDTYTAGFPVDFAWQRRVTNTGNFVVGTRLLGKTFLTTDTPDVEGANNDGTLDHQTGWYSGSTTISTDYVSWMWKRAPGYLDVVAYTGTGSNRTISHNLGAVPEMMWVKRRNVTNNWKTFHSSLGATKSMELNTTVAAETNGSALWNSTAPTASVFSLGTASDVNGSGQTFVAYLFATSDVSKVGSYTGNGSSQNIDCGFSSGARFVLIKRYDGTDSWYVADSVRGISSGQTDKILKLNSNDAEFTESDSSADYIAPHASGFNLPANSPLNGSGDDFIFYAIAQSDQDNNQLTKGVSTNVRIS